MDPPDPGPSARRPRLSVGRKTGVWTTRRLEDGLRAADCSQKKGWLCTRIPSHAPLLPGAASGPDSKKKRHNYFYASISSPGFCRLFRLLEELWTFPR